MNKTQLTLKISALDYADLPLTDIDPHPLNPRPESELYGCKVDDEKVAELMHVIGANGYDPSEPIKVRSLNGRYQIVRGHHRWVACRELALPTIPAVVREMTDAEAAIALLVEQGKEVDSWGKALHAYQCCAAYGQDGLMTVSEYASLLGVGINSVSQWISASRVREMFHPGETFPLTVKACRQIATLKESDWEWFTSFCIENDLGQERRETAISALKSFPDIPTALRPWLNPTIWKQKVVADVVTGDTRLLRDLNLWIDTAVENMEALPTERKVWVFSAEGEPYRETIEPRLMFLDKLDGLKNPSAKRIKQAAADIFSHIKASDAAYEQWQRQQQDAEAAQAQKEAEQQERLEMEMRFDPTGYCMDIRDGLEDMADHFDMILTDPPYLLSNDGITCRGNDQVRVDKNFEDKAGDAISPDEWLPICLDCLKPGGVLAFTCTEHLNISRGMLEGHGFEVLETLVWIKRSAPPRLTPTGHRACHELIWVARKPGESHYFAYDLLMEKYGSGNQVSSVLEFEQCSGKERLGWHDTQKPLKLWTYLLEAYCPEEGTVLDPFGGTGTTAVAAKQTGRASVWVEKEEQFYSKTQSRIDSTPFAWEVSV